MHRVRAQSHGWGAWAAMGRHIPWLNYVISQASAAESVRRPSSLHGDGGRVLEGSAERRGSQSSLWRYPRSALDDSQCYCIHVCTYKVRIYEPMYTASIVLCCTRRTRRQQNVCQNVLSANIIKLCSRRAVMAGQGPSTCGCSQSLCTVPLCTYG